MTSDTHHTTSITTPSDTQIRIERVFEAPRELVWEAHADPELLGQWLGPDEHPITVAEMDLRPGGRYRWVSPGPEGQELSFSGEYREVSPPEAIEMTFEFSGAPGHVSVDRLELQELEGGRTKLVVISTFANQEDRDAMLHSGMEKGVGEGYAKLDKLLARRHVTGSIVTGVDFVCVPTSDLARAREFYTDVLGLTPSSVWQRPGQDALGAEFETGGVTLALLASAALGIEFQPNNVPIALQVADVGAARAELESRGVEFMADTLDSGVCHQAFFKDPDGNALNLHHRYAPRGAS